MGGYGSGRSGGRPTWEACGSYVLSAKVLKPLPYAGSYTARGRWTWGEEAFSLDYEIEAAANGGRPSMRVTHPIRSGDERPFTYYIHLDTTPARFGGHRWWFICPITGRLAHKLFLPRGAHQFASRHAYRLGYACQRESRTDRLMRKARRLHRALGGHGEAIGDGYAPPKPKWMRWRTYERKVAEWQEADEAADQTWTLEAMRRFGMRF